jgi:hypothetical protein
LNLASGGRRSPWQTAAHPPATSARPPRPCRSRRRVGCRT